MEPCELPRADNGLLELKECNFAQGVGSGHSLIKFYAPWLAQLWHKVYTVVI